MAGIGRLIHIEMTSPKALVRTVLKALASLYVYTCSRLPVHLRGLKPINHMAGPVYDEQRAVECRRLDAHVAARNNNETDQVKLDRLG